MVRRGLSTQALPQRQGLAAVCWTHGLTLVLRSSSDPQALLHPSMCTLRASTRWERPNMLGCAESGSSAQATVLRLCALAGAEYSAGKCHLDATDNVASQGHYAAGECECDPTWDLTSDCSQKQCPVHRGKLCNGQGYCNRGYGDGGTSFEGTFRTGRHRLLSGADGGCCAAGGVPLPSVRCAVRCGTEAGWLSWWALQATRLAHVGAH